MPRKFNRKDEEWAEIDLADLGLEDPMADVIGDDDFDDEPVSVIRKDITSETVQKAFVPEGREAESPHSEVAKDWPKKEPEAFKMAIDKPMRPYPYQDARSNISPEDQREIEPVVFDSPDGDVYVCKSIFSKTPTEDEAARRGDKQPHKQTVVRINAEERNMKTLAAMEIAMGRCLGVAPGVGGLGNLRGLGKMKLKSSLKKLAPAKVVKNLRKNPMINAAFKIGETIATGGAAPIVEALQIKKRKAQQKKAAQKNAAAAEAAKKAKEDENYIRSTTKINLDASGKKESATIMIPEYGPVTIPIKLYESTKPITGIFDAAIRYKTAQDAQAALAKEANDLEVAEDAVETLTTIKEQEVQAITNPSYTPPSPYAMTATEQIQAYAPAGVNYMETKKYPPTPQYINTVAAATSDALLQKQQQELALLKAQYAQMQAERIAAQQAQEEMAYYVEESGGIPKAPEPLEPQRTEDYYPDFETAYGDSVDIEEEY